MTNETKAREGEAVERVVKALEQQMEEQDETLPSSVAREHGLVWLEGWFDLRAALASIQPPPDVVQMQAEIERLREEADAANGHADELEARAEAAEAKLAEAVEALTHYGGHNRDCTARKGANYGDEHCDCGFTTTLGRIKETSRG